jgi:cytochrome c biogenesis protein CcdA
MIEIALAFGAGVLIVASPCILPMHPILLGASIGQRSHSRSLFSRGVTRRHRLLHAVRHGSYRVAFGFLLKP